MRVKEVRVFKIDKDSWNALSARFTGLTREVDLATRPGMQAGGEVLLRAVRRNASARDHTASDLAALDHPYARRHGAIQVGRLGGQHISRPHIVHRVGGGLLASIRGQYQSNGRDQLGRFTERFFEVGLIDPPAYAEYVVRGTRVMLGRDVVGATAAQPDVIRRMNSAVVRAATSGMRSIRGVR